MLLTPLLLVSGCVTVGHSISPDGVCGPNDKPIRLTPEIQDQLTDDQVRQILAYNEGLVDRGCAVPNK